MIVRLMPLVFVCTTLFSMTTRAQDGAPPAALEGDAAALETPDEGLLTGATDPAAPAEESETAPATTSDDEKKPEAQVETKPEAPAVEAEPMGGLASFAIAYGTGLAAAGVAYSLMLTSTAISLGSMFLGAAATPILGPVSYVVQALSCLSCCFLPAGQGALINFMGDTVTGSDPSLAYAWTILASYVSCYAFSCVGLMAYGAIIFAVVGAAIASVLTGQPIPGQENLTYVFSGSLLGIFGAVALVQPIVPAAVYAMTRDTGPGKEGDDYVDTDDEYVRAPRAPGARPEFALGSVNPAAMAF